jgi:hypothetical protein
MNTKKIPIPALAAVLALSISACGKKDTPSADGGGAKTSEIPTSVIASTAPEGALSVVAARAAAKPGQPITLRGKVAGKMNPISDAAAILVLADETAIKSCDEIPGDMCETPWDYCCEESATIAASTATIQVRDADGKLVRATLRGVGDLKELSRLVVSGTVDVASTDTALIVNADKIHVETP